MVFNYATELEEQILHASSLHFEVSAQRCKLQSEIE